jgi:hypothetical protein
MAFELKLDLSKHCIETEIKRQHNRAVGDYFRAAPSSRRRLEAVIEATRQLLESVDFRTLRSAYPPLSGQSEAHAVLAQEDDRFVIILDDTVIRLRPAKLPG